MAAVLSHLASYGKVYRWDAVALQIQALLADWLAVVNSQHPSEPIMVLKGPADDGLYCGWTLRLQQPEGAVIAQCVAGSINTPVSSDVNRIDAWFGFEAHYDPLDTTIGSHGLVKQANGSAAAITSRRGTIANLLAYQGSFQTPVDTVVFQGTAPGQEFFGWSTTAFDSTAYQHLPLLIARCQANQRWLLMTRMAQSKWTTFMALPAPPSYCHVLASSTPDSVETLSNSKTIHSPVQLTTTFGSTEFIAQPIRRYWSPQLPPDFAHAIKTSPFQLVDSAESESHWFNPNRYLQVRI
jgi:hypothetical protein